MELGRATAFMGGLAVIAFALVGPIDSESARVLSWHMAQHLLLVSVAAPLLAIGRPVALMLDLISPGFALKWRWDWRGPLATALIGGVSLTVLLGWHVPALYQMALAHEPVHIVEHATLTGSSMLLWANLIGRAQIGASVVWLFVITLPMTAFGVAMTIARTPWYSDYVTGSRAAAVRDQQLAGVIMWAFGGVAALVGAVSMFAAWLVGASSVDVADDALVPATKGLRP